MKRFILVLSAVALLGTACSKKEISALDRKEAANFASEADFALQIKEHARAEDLLAKATALAPDAPEYWLGLGGVRAKLGKKNEARKAYEETLAIYKGLYKKDAGDGELLIQQAYVLALLNRADDARATLEKAVKSHPTNSKIKGFITNKALEKMLADPAFKEMAI